MSVDRTLQQKASEEFRALVKKSPHWTPEEEARFLQMIQAQVDLKRAQRLRLLRMEKVDG